MDPLDRIRENFEASIRSKRESLDVLASPIARGAQRLIDALRQGGKVLCCGNGGSAADSQHLASELLNRFEQERLGLAAMALTTDSSTLTSIANDYSFADIFARQVQALGAGGDVLIPITTSGTSPNIINAVAAAHAADMSVIALTGRDGGSVPGVLRDGDIEIRVPGTSTARIQETHILAIHCLCDLIDHALIE